MTEMSVVFPHPEGPTSMSSSPRRTSRSMPRRGDLQDALAIGLGNAAAAHGDLFLERCAVSASWLLLEDDRGFQMNDFPDAEQRGKNADDHDRRGTAEHQLPGENEGKLGVAGRPTR